MVLLARRARTGTPASRSPVEDTTLPESNAVAAAATPRSDPPDDKPARSPTRTAGTAGREKRSAVIPARPLRRVKITRPNRSTCYAWRRNRPWRCGPDQRRRADDRLAADGGQQPQRGHAPRLSSEGKDPGEC